MSGWIMMVDATPWIDRYVAQLQEMGAIRSAAVERAFRRVPRHRLIGTFYHFPTPPDASPTPIGPVQPVPIAHDPDNPAPEHLDMLYANRVAVTRIENGVATSSASEPGLVAAMLEHLELSPGMNVLEIGAGTGYNAALMAEIVGEQPRIVSVDIQSDVVEQTQRLLAAAGYPRIDVLLRDGFEGVPETAPYDRIVATVGCSDLSPHWVTQLRSEGLMLIPLAHRNGHPLVRVWREDGRIRGRVVAPAGFMSIQGAMAAPDPQPRQRSASFAPDMTKARRLPLFDGFEPERMALEWSPAYSGFYYFLALRDRRIFWSMHPRGFGLHDADSGTVLISPEDGHILADGDHTLHNHLHQLHAEWQALGSPKLTDYTMEFQPRAEPSPPPVAGTWTVERQFYRQMVTASTAP